MSRTETPIRVTIVNDYEVVVRGLAAMLAPFSDRVVVVESEAGGLPDEPTDIALFDTFAGRRRSLARIDELADDIEIGRVVLYTWDLPQEFAQAVNAASLDGVIMKSTTGADPCNPQDVGSTLTEREREVLALLARGATNREIASELYLSFDTIKTHVRKVFAKLGVANRTQAAIVAREYGLQLSAPSGSLA
jgi:DNA-binding NarL/FixJ family response regulator